MKRFLLLLTALLGIMGLRAEVTFISEVKIATTTTALTNEGYTAINRDLNEGAGGDYIYLGYKTTTDPTQAITSLAILVDEGYSSDTYLTSGITLGDGLVYYKAPYNGVGSNGDLNAHAGGNWLYLFYSKSKQHDLSVKPITSIAINGSGTQVSGVNLNAGTGSKTADLWLTIEGTHTHNNSGIRNNGNGTHTYYCTDCGAYIGNESDACTLTLSTTDDAHKNYCTVCGYVALEEAHTFDNGICTYCNAYQKPDFDTAYGYYLLGNAGNALWWNNNIHNQGKQSSVRLTADIDLNPGYVFASDGTYTAPEGAHRLETWTTPTSTSSSCNFYGGSHVLSGLYSVSSDGFAGLCGELNAGFIIRELIIRDSYVSGAKAGAFAAYLNGGTVNDCGAVNIKGSCTTDYGSVMIGELRRGTFDTSWSYSPNSGLKNAMAYVSGDMYACYIGWCVGLADSGDLNSRFTACSKEEFASGRVAWFANAGNSAGCWKQIICVDTIPSFNGPSVYGEYNANGNLTGYSNRSKGDIIKHGKATVGDLAKLIYNLNARTGTYGNADVDGDNILTEADATQLREIILGRDPFTEVSSISITGDNHMKPNTTQTLTATILPANASLPYLKWTSSADTIVSVSNGTLTALKSGRATITVRTVDGSGVTATFVVTVDNSGEVDGRHYIDLGLPSGTLWASMNLGAGMTVGTGDYLAWGETEGTVTEEKTTFTWSNYKYFDSSNNKLTEYCTSSNYGNADNKTEIELEDDAAFKNWNEEWRIPTTEQLQELVNTSYTTSTYATQDGVKGLLITSLTNGNSIFLPVTGYYKDSSCFDSNYGYYWSRTLNSNNPYTAYYLYFSLYGTFGGNYTDERYKGFNIRPVLAQ